MDKKFTQKVAIIGAGLAGSEASWMLANAGIEVSLFEVKRIKLNPAQKIEGFAELVCTNSLKSKEISTPHGILKQEMYLLKSLVLECAHQCEVPAGEALAVDREKFSSLITDKLSSHSLIKVEDREISNPLELKEEGFDFVIIATGPLTTNSLGDWIQKELAGDDLYFYDAIAPIVDADTLDFSKLYFKDRYADPSEEANYLNAPMNKEQYTEFIKELVAAKKVPAHNFEKENFFEACLPIDIMAQRGKDTPRFSCMKPVGLSLGDIKPYAVVQLRKENLLGSAYNMVGFQNRLTYGEQKRVFKLIPGFEEAEFIHLGSVHRNTFVHAAKTLNYDLSSKKYSWLYLAGQITGVEGYTESSTCGLYVARQVLRKIKGEDIEIWPKETAIGALVNYLMSAEKPAPSSINLALFPPVELKNKKLKRSERKRAKRKLVAQRAKEFLANMSFS